MSVTGDCGYEIPRNIYRSKFHARNVSFIEGSMKSLYLCKELITLTLFVSNLNLDQAEVTKLPLFLFSVVGQATGRA